jgi:hypothetical protein
VIVERVSSRVDEKAPDPGRNLDSAVFVLVKGVDYVRGWLLAVRAVAALRAQLAASGLDGGFPELRAEVTVAGAGLVELGHVSPQTAHRLARLLAHAHGEAAHEGAEEGPRRHSDDGERDRAA